MASGTRLDVCIGVRMDDSFMSPVFLLMLNKMKVQRQKGKAKKHTIGYLIDQHGGEAEV